jgi:hypothetical protein|tara:strand:- start:76 stop:321 length:246 start_codon:yes stop_codon:yes gene_type:complete
VVFKVVQGKFQQFQDLLLEEEEVDQQLVVVVLQQVEQVVVEKVPELQVFPLQMQQEILIQGVVVVDLKMAQVELVDQVYLL